MKLPLIAMYITFSVFAMTNVCSTIFLSVYVWKQQESFFMISAFYFFTFLFVFIGVMVGAFFMFWFGSRWTFLCSSFTALGMYLFFWTEGELSLQAVALAGILNGLFIGLFYAGFNFYSLWFASQERLSNVLSLQYIINGVMQIVVPPIIGWIIFVYSYHVFFVTALLILLVQACCSSLIPQVRIRFPFRRKEFFIPLEEGMKGLGFSSAAYGFFLSFIHMSLGVFVYLYVQNEWALGGWNMLFACISVFTYYMLGRTFLKPFGDVLGMIGVIISTAATLTLFFHVPVTYIVFNTVISASLPMLWVPAFTQHFHHIFALGKASSANTLTKVMQLLVFREFSICIGKLSFIALLLFQILYFSPSLSLIVFFLCFMPVAIYVLGHKDKGLMS
ncbi:hypothetical protein [Caldalkalibacillus salinus]|uniref:hypothetical protein n=1 Tax=Caldalkalibacillus salinus TaxID=2803787 RepID=UPI001921A2F9|nr:hypothetical protein [Caldalkalibacillus salinus]